jgi:hypothetical protein
VAVLTAQRISSLMVELLTRTLVLPRTVAMIPGTEFTGSNGDTITVRVRQPRVSKIQANPGDPITFDAPDEVAVDVTVEHIYDGVRVTDEMLTLELEDLGAQILQPMAQSVAIGAENQLAGVINDIPADILNVDSTTVEDDVLAARTTLGRNEVPLGGRWLACSPEFAEVLLSLDTLTPVDASGSPSALRDAMIGRYRGFGVVESAGLEDGTALAYHSSAIAWGNRAPAIPRGAGDAAVSNEQGIAIRTVFDFDPTILSDVIAISTFAGPARSTRTTRAPTAAGP